MKRLALIVLTLSAFGLVVLLGSTPVMGASVSGHWPAASERPRGFGFQKQPGPPRAGQSFTGVVAWIPLSPSFHVVNVLCKATLGGHWADPDHTVFDGGGVPIRPIIRRYYARLANGDRHVNRITCGWRLPKSARGKLLSLEIPGCEDACERGGFSINYRDDRRNVVGGSDFTQATWRVRR